MTTEYRGLSPFQVRWFDEEGRVKMPIPIHADKMEKIGILVWMHIYNQIGTIVSEDVCSRGKAPCYLVRTLDHKYIPCFAGNVAFMTNTEALRQVLCIMEVERWREEGNVYFRTLFKAAFNS